MPFFGRGMFLWGLLAIAIPIIIYLLFRQKYQRIPWAAMEFLLAAIKKNKRRLQIENLLLLLLRILIIALLIGALAKPMLHQESAFARHIQGSRTVILLIDVSYSTAHRTGMRSALEKAQQMAKKIIADLAIGDTVAIVPFHRSVRMNEVEPEPITGPRTKRRLTAEIDALVPTSYSTEILAAFEACETMLKKPQFRGARVFLFSDFTRVGWTKRKSAAGEESDGTVIIENPALKNVMERLTKSEASFTFVDVGPVDTAPNCTVGSFLPEDAFTVTGYVQVFYVRVKNHGSEPVRGTLNFRVDGTDAGRHAIEIKPNSETTFPFPYEFQEPGSHSLAVRFDSDNLMLDNERFLVLEVQKSVKALLVPGERVLGGTEWGDDEVDFVREALNPVPEGSPAQRVSVISSREVDPNELDNEKLDNYSFIVIANVGSLSEQTIQRLERYVRNGGGLLIFMGDLVSPDAYNAMFTRVVEKIPEKPEDRPEKAGAEKEREKETVMMLPARLLAPVSDETGHNPFVMTLEKLDHPCFATDFSVPKLAAFGRATFRKFVQTKVDEKDRDVQVLARFSDAGRSPAILERRYKRGRIVLVTTTADVAWNRWAAHPAFIAFTQDCSRYLASGKAQRRTLDVGEPFEAEFPEEAWTEDVELINPREEREPLDFREVEFEGKRFYRLEYAETDAAGIYTVSLNRPGRPGELHHFAANVDPVEGDLEKIGESDLRAFVPQKLKWIWWEYAKRENAAESEKNTAGSRPQLWFYFVMLVLALMVLETILAQRFGSRRAETEGAES